jgi:O-antigen ligase
MISVFVIFAFFWLRTRKIRRIALCAALLSPLVVLMPETFFSRVENATQHGGMARWYVWQAGFEALKHHGLFGAGLENFPLVYQKYAGFAPVFWGDRRSAHNTYLSLAVEVGIVGLFILARAFIVQFRSSRRVTFRDPLTFSLAPVMIWSLEAACWSMLAAGTFLDMLWRKQFWFAWMMLAAATRFAEKESNQHSESGTISAKAEANLVSRKWQF